MVLKRFFTPRIVAVGCCFFNLTTEVTSAVGGVGRFCYDSSGAGAFLFFLLRLRNGIASSDGVDVSSSLDGLKSVQFLPQVGDSAISAHAATAAKSVSVSAADFKRKREDAFKTLFRQQRGSGAEENGKQNGEELLNPDYQRMQQHQQIQFGWGDLDCGNSGSTRRKSSESWEEKEAALSRDDRLRWSRLLTLMSSIDEANPGAPREDPLDCWLWNLRVSLPDQSFREGLIRVSSTDMICTHFEISGIKSSYHRASPRIRHTRTSGKSITARGFISIQITGIAASCSGNYHAGFASGSLSASLQRSTLDLTIHITPDSHFYMAHDVSVSHCDSSSFSIPAQNIHFTGSFSAKIANLFAGQISNYITKSLQTQICPGLSKGINEKLTQKLVRTNDLLIKLLREGKAATVDPIVPKKHAGVKLLRWNEDVPVLQSAFELFNTFMSQQFHLGVTCGINGIIDWLTNHTGSVLIEFPKDVEPKFNWSVPNGLGKVELGLRRFNFSGMDTLSQLRVFETDSVENVDVTNGNSADVNSVGEISSGAGLTTSITSNGTWSIRVGLDLTVFPSAKSVGRQSILTEEFELLVVTSNPALYCRLVLGVHKEEFTSLRANAPFRPCLWDTVLLANMTNITALVDLEEVHISPRKLSFSDDNNDEREELCLEVNKSFSSSSSVSTPYSSFSSPPASLEKDLDDLIDNVLSLFIGEYGRLVTDVSRAVVQGPVRAHLNTIISKWIDNDDVDNDVSFTLKDDVPTNATVGRLLGPQSTTSLSSSAVCRPQRINGTSSFVHFDESPVVSFLNSVMNGPNGDAAKVVNRMVHCSLNYMSDEGILNGTIYDYRRRVGRHGEGELVFNVKNLLLSNLASFNEIDLIEPKLDHYHLMNTFRYGERHPMRTCSDGSGDSVSNMSINYNGTTIENSFDNNNNVNDCGIPSASVVLQVKYEPLGLNGIANVSFLLNDGGGGVEGKSGIDNTKNTMNSLSWKKGAGGSVVKAGIELGYDKSVLSSLNIEQILGKVYCGVSPVSFLQLYGLQGTTIGSFSSVHIDSSLDWSGNSHRPVELNGTFGGKNDSDSIVAVNSFLQQSILPLIERTLNAMGNLTTDRSRYLCEDAHLPGASSKSHSGTSAGGTSSSETTNWQLWNVFCFLSVACALIASTVLSMLQHNHGGGQRRTNGDISREPLEEIVFEQEGNEDAIRGNSSDENGINTSRGGGSSGGVSSIRENHLLLSDPEREDEELPVEGRIQRQAQVVTGGRTPARRKGQSKKNKKSGNHSPRERGDRQHQQRNLAPMSSLGLMFHPTISDYLRYTIPILLMCTMTLFLSSNISTGASVDPVITSTSVQDDSSSSSLHLPPVFAFSLGNTLTEMYKAGVYPLMILIVLFSGVWPYVKLLLMLYAWIVPSYKCSLKRRGNLLWWLDALGKYSLVDTYVLVLMMVAFRFHLEIMNGEYALDVYVTPKYGFYGFLVATISSLILGHVILHCHRKSLSTTNLPLAASTRHGVVTSGLSDNGGGAGGRVDAGQEDSDENEFAAVDPISVEPLKESLRTHLYRTAKAAEGAPFIIANIPENEGGETEDQQQQQEGNSGNHGNKIRKVKLSKKFQFFIFLIMLSSSILMLIGITIQSFHFEIHGLAGWLLEETREEGSNATLISGTAIRSYSFLSLGRAIPSSVQDPHTFWIRFFQFFYYFFGIIMPMFCFVSSLLLFVVPMKRRRQRQCLVLSEVCNAWNAMEVFLLSIVVALLQISRFSQFLVGHHCDTINRILEQWSWFQERLDGYTVCFDVTAFVSVEVWLLLVGTVANCGVTFVILRLAQQVIDERMEDEVEVAVFGDNGEVNETEEGQEREDRQEGIERRKMMNWPVQTQKRTFVECLDSCCCFGMIVLEEHQE